MHGANYFNTPPSPYTVLGSTLPNGQVNWNGTAVTQPGGVPVNYTDVPAYSRVEVNTYRVLLGLDYSLQQNVSTFLRYNYYDYDDVTQAYNSGVSHIFLAGVTGTY